MKMIGNVLPSIFLCSSSLKIILISFLLVILLAACGQNQTIKIGFIGGISGRVADLGIAGRNGAQLAVEEWNQKGGIRGKRIEILVEDDGQSPESAQQAFDILKQKQVAAIVGPMTSSMAMELVPRTNKSKILMLSPTATTSQLSGRDDLFFRVIGPADSYAKKNAEYQYKILGKRRAAIIIDINNEAYSRSWGNSFKTNFEQLGGKVLIYHSFRSGKGVHFKLEAKKLLDTRPDTIQVISNALDASMLIQQIRRVNPDIHISISEWAATERLTDMGGNAVNGVFVAQFFDRTSQKPEYIRFSQSYQKRFSREPGFASVAGYDAMQVVLSAIAKRNPDEPLKSALLRLKAFPGVQGKLSFDKYGDAKRPTYFSIIKNGKFETMTEQ